MAVMNTKIQREPVTRVRTLEDFVEDRLGGTIVNVLRVRREPEYSLELGYTNYAKPWLQPVTDTAAYDVRFDSFQLQKLQSQFAANERERELAIRYNSVIAQRDREAQLRRQVPALQQAYESYQLLLAIAAGQVL